MTDSKEKYCYVCDNCGQHKHLIFVDADTSYNPDTQEYEIEYEGDYAQCRSYFCDGGDAGHYYASMSWPRNKTWCIMRSNGLNEAELKSDDLGENARDVDITWYGEDEDKAHAEYVLMLEKYGTTQDIFLFTMEGEEYKDTVHKHITGDES